MHAVDVEVMECLWRPAVDVLGDRSAFDAAVITQREDGSRHLVGVEVKYTEQFNRTIYNSDGYRQVHEYSGWFHPGTARPLLGPATNQLWRTSLLAAACAQHGVMGVDSASVVVMCLGEDPDATRALAGLSAALREPQEHCRIVSLESAEMQAGLLVPSDQKQALAIAEQTITQLEKGQARAMLVMVARVWDEGDLDQLSSFEQWCGCADTEDERQFLRRVNDERNGPMAERIDALHSAGRTVFAAVGALHMTGAHGLPQLLQQRGYTVERIRFAPR